MPLRKIHGVMFNMHSNMSYCDFMVTMPPSLMEVRVPGYPSDYGLWGYLDIQLEVLRSSLPDFDVFFYFSFNI